MEAVADADVIICATLAAGYVLRARDLAAGRSRLVIDLAHPRDVDPDVGRLAGARLINLDTVWRQAPQRSASAPVELAKARSIVDSRVEGYTRWLAERWHGRLLHITTR